MDRYYKPGILLETLNFYFDVCLDVKKSGANWLSADNVVAFVQSCVCCAFEEVVAPWCSPLTLQPEQSGGMGLIPSWTLPLERHDRASWT